MAALDMKDDIDPKRVASLREAKSLPHSGSSRYQIKAKLPKVGQADRKKIRRHSSAACPDGRTILLIMHHVHPTPLLLSDFSHGCHPSHLPRSKDLPNRPLGDGSTQTHFLNGFIAQLREKQFEWTKYLTSALNHVMKRDK